MEKCSNFYEMFKDCVVLKCEKAIKSYICIVSLTNITLQYRY